MKRILIFLFLLISFKLFSFDSTALLKYSTVPINLTQGIESPEHKNIYDFSNISKDMYIGNQSYITQYSTDKETIIPFTPANDRFYSQDFSEDPFNGHLEMYIMGEPTPPVTITLLIASLVSIAFLQYNKYSIHPSLKSIYSSENKF